MPIKAKISSSEMPLGWMALKALDFPGQFYLSNSDGNFIIFSGRGFPSHATSSEQLLEFLNNIPHTQLRFLTADLITTTPTDAQPLHDLLWQRSTINESPTNSAEETQVFVRNLKGLMLARYFFLTMISAQEQANCITIFNSRTLYLLEKTALHAFKIRNLYRSNPNSSRLKKYLSADLFKGTRNELPANEISSIPTIEAKATYHILNLMGDAGDALTPEEIQHLHTALSSSFQPMNTEIITRPEAHEANIVIKNYILPAAPRLFLYRIRLACYLNALEERFTLRWVSSTVNPSPVHFSSLETKPDHLETKASNTAAFFRSNPSLDTILPTLQTCKLADEYYLLMAKALRRAANSNLEKEVIALLTLCGPEIINRQDENPHVKRTALHYAAAKDHHSIIRCLLTHHARTDIRDAAGQTAAEIMHERSVMAAHSP